MIQPQLNDSALSSSPLERSANADPIVNTAGNAFVVVAGLLAMAGAYKGINALWFETDADTFREGFLESGKLLGEAAASAYIAGAYKIVARYLGS